MTTGISQLNHLYQKHQFSFKLIERPVDWLCQTQVACGSFRWDILVHDESHDLDITKPLLCLYLTLYSLEDYIGTSDYLSWLKENMLSPSDVYLQYYRSLAAVITDWQENVGKVDSFLSSWDYEMRTGEYADLLRR